MNHGGGVHEHIDSVQRLLARCSLEQAQIEAMEGRDRGISFAKLCGRRQQGWVDESSMKYSLRNYLASLPVGLRRNPTKRVRFLGDWMAAPLRAFGRSIA
jgi:hypothetical protein